MRWWWGWHCCDCRCRCCPLLSTPVYCNLYIETPDLGDGSLFKVDSTSLCFSVPERSGGTQPCDGQHAPQRRHARRSHAPGLLPGTSCPLQSLAPSLSHPSITVSTLIPLSSIRYKSKHFLHLDILFQSFFLTLPRHQVPNLRNKLHSSSFDTFPSTFLSHSGYLNAPKLHTRLHLRPVEPNSVTQPSRIHQLLHLHHLSVSRPGCAGRVWGFGVWERGGACGGGYDRLKMEESLGTHTGVQACIHKQAQAHPQPCDGQHWHLARDMIRERERERDWVRG